MVLSQLPDQFPHFHRLPRIQADRRFIQDQDVRCAAQCLRNTDALTVSLAQVADNPFPDFLQGAQLDNLVHMLPVCFPGHFPQFADKGQVLLHRHFVIQRRLLRQIADHPFAGPRVSQHILSAHPYLAFCRRKIAGHQVQRRGLARAVAAQQTHRLPFGNMKRDIPEPRDASVQLGNMFQFNHCFALRYNTARFEK